MHWLPKLQGFSERLSSALETADQHALFAELVALSRHDLDFLQTMQLDRALDRVDVDAIEGVDKVRIAVLGSSTMDHLAPSIRVARLRREKSAVVHVGPYGQYRQELLDPESGYHEFGPNVTVISASLHDAIAGVPVTATVSEAAERISDYVDSLTALWALARDADNSSVIQQTFVNIGDSLFGNFDRFVPGAPANLIRELNRQIVEAAACNDVALLDMERATELRGIDFWFDAAKWLQAKMDITPQAAPLYGELVSHIVDALSGSSKKCLVVDLDNTLWGGVVGDDGIDNIVIGEGSALGEAFLAFQRYIRQMSDRGIILAVCSKNELATAEAVFREHPEMLLKRSDFGAFVANWHDKAQNLQRIAEELNIGIDSLVFVDDNPAERARIRQSFPLVGVPELPDDPALYVDCIASAGYFEAVSFTGDDAIRSNHYAQNAARRDLQKTFASIDDYLGSLEMALTWDSFADVNLPRVTQLVNKTNQFNTTTIRRTAEELGTIDSEETSICLQFRLLDRFGDNGLVSALIMREAEDGTGAYYIDSWVMSCRVFGRQLEHEIMNIAVDAARKFGAKWLIGIYIPTEKNRLIEDLYPKLGFEPLFPDESVREPARHWKLDLKSYTDHETHIDVTGPLDD